MSATTPEIPRTAPAAGNVSPAQQADAADRAARVRTGTPVLGDQDVYLFNEGTHSRLYEKLGAHVLSGGGVYFAVWAPNAHYVSVIGDFNEWNPAANPMTVRGGSGLWEATVADAVEGSLYKFHIASKLNGYVVDKVDPFGFQHAVAPRKESVVRSIDYTWNDADWMAARGAKQQLDRPMSTYELHFGSWARVPEDGDRFLTYHEMAPKLAQYLVDRAFTHVEFLPLMEHPFYGSWGYQTTGYFAPTSRFGSPQDLMFLIDTLHQAGIGVILDWVPSHFPEDEHGLKYFDGTHLYEHADPRKGFHPDWKSAIFNYGRNEVRAFLHFSSADLLARQISHRRAARGCRRVDAIPRLRAQRRRVDPQSSIGGRRRISKPINFLRQLNREVYGQLPRRRKPSPKRSTSWPDGLAPHPHRRAGLRLQVGHGLDERHPASTSRTEPIYRQISPQPAERSAAVYQYAENYVLPLSA